MPYLLAIPLCCPVCPPGSGLDVVLSEDSPEVVDGPAVLLHGLALAVFVEGLHGLGVLVDGLRSEDVAGVVAKVNHQAVLLRLLSVARSEDVMVVEHGAPAAA